MNFLKVLSTQIYLLISKKTFLLTLISLMVLNILAFWLKVSEFRTTQAYFTLPASLAFSLNFGFNGRFVVPLVAILSALPFSSSYIDDKKAKLHSAIFTRLSSYKYYFSKLLCVFFATFLCIAIPFIINQILCLSFFPVENIHSDVSLSSSHSYNFFVNLNYYAFKHIYLQNIHVYNLLYTIIFSAFWSLISSLSCAISYCFSKSKIVVLLIPFLLYQLAQLSELIIFGNAAPLDKVYLSFTDYILPQSYGLIISPQIFITYIFVFLFFTIAIVFFKVKSEQENAH